VFPPDAGWIPHSFTVRNPPTRARHGRLGCVAMRAAESARAGYGMINVYGARDPPDETGTAVRRERCGWDAACPYRDLFHARPSILPMTTSPRTATPPRTQKPRRSGVFGVASDCLGPVRMFNWCEERTQTRARNRATTGFRVASFSICPQMCPHPMPGRPPTDAPRASVPPPSAGCNLLQSKAARGGAIRCHRCRVPGAGAGVPELVSVEPCSSVQRSPRTSADRTLGFAHSS